MRGGLVAVLCLATWAVAQAAAAPVTSRMLYAAVPACVEDSSQASCKSYKYPDEMAERDIADDCTMMSDMVGCTIHRLCKEGKLKGKYCAPMSVLAALCLDMPGMSPCNNYNKLCSATSVVQQCRDQPAPPSVPTTEASKAAILAACSTHAMPSCGTCKPGPAQCPDVLGSMAALCHEHGAMAMCAPFFAFCSANTGAFGPLCSAGHTYLPSMKMYFHQRVAEMVLWREWIPRTNGKYAAAIIAVMCFAVVSQALKVGRLLLEARWAAQLKPAPRLRGDATAAIGVAIKSPDELPRRTAAWRRALQARLMTTGQLRRSAIRSLFQGAASVLDYFNMLVVMTFNVGLFCGVVTGYMLGTLLFSHLLEQRPSAAQPDPLPFAATVTATQQEEEEEAPACCCTPANMEIGCGC